MYFFTFNVILFVIACFLVNKKAVNFFVFFTPVALFDITNLAGSSFGWHPLKKGV
uniref:Uncharacterized protein n=1 Tax=Rhizophora mucronata TaxID=61149 RepID=A0A2P2NWC3_RHIMU